MADPRYFPRGTPTLEVGVLQNFGRKMHIKNERIWAGGGMRSWQPLDPPMLSKKNGWIGRRNRQ